MSISFDDTMFSTYFMVFCIIFIGTLWGKIKCCKISLGIAGILIAGIFAGFLFSFLNINIKEDIFSKCSVLSDFGMYIFLASLSLETGEKISLSRKYKYLYSIALGTITVFTGALISLALSYAFSLDKAIIMGTFSGAMTSTPALAEALRITNNNDVTAAYASTYFFSVILTVGFIRLVLKTRTSVKEKAQSAGNISTSIIPLSLTVILGLIIGNLMVFNFSLGSTLSIMICGIFVGLLCRRKKEKSCSSSVIKNLGLMLFFQGIGLKAGSNIINSFLPSVILIGIMSSLSAILIGYFASVKVFKFSKQDSLCIISGGMTSSPAIGVLNEENKALDSSLFTFSYIGALFALLLTIRIFNIIL